MLSWLTSAENLLVALFNDVWALVWPEGWEWRDAQTLWFMLVPVVWWLIAYVIKKRQTAHYADAELLPWVKADATARNGLNASAGLSDGEDKSANPQPGRFFSSYPFGRRVLGLWHFIQRGFGRLVSPMTFLSFAWIAMIIALAGPRSAIPAPNESSRAGVDILIGLDVSRSMLVQDMGGNRFIFSRALIESLLNRLEPNDRVGLMVYAGKPHLVTPLTLDRALFKHYLSLVRPGMLPTRGSQIYPALDFGLKHLKQTAGKAQVLVMLTNGEPVEYQPQTLPEDLAKRSDKTSDKGASDTKVILVGVGKNAASRIPEFTDPTGYLHAFGKLVTSRLEADFLKKLAGQVGGEYLQATNQGAFLQQLLDAVTEQAQKRTIVSSTPIWQDHAWPFELAAFILLVLAFYPIKLRSEVSSSVGVLAVGLISASLLGLPTPSQAQDDVESPSADLSASQQISKQQRAYQAFQSNEFDLSEQLYDGLNQYDGWFGAGDAAYRAADYESAVLYFTQAAVGGRNDQERAQALFNLGNTFFKSNLFPQAIEAYEQALVYLPDYDKAKHNLELAKKMQRQQRKGKQQNDEKGNGSGRGDQSRDAEGSFYGGQKPNNDPGKGVSGDSQEGEKQAKDFVLPDEEDRTDFRLKPSEKLQATDKAEETANAILDQQKRRRTIEKFEQKMQQVQDKQSLLLQHLFEREEGFQAEQEQAHDLPGVKPW